MPSATLFCPYFTRHRARRFVPRGGKKLLSRNTQLAGGALDRPKRQSYSYSAKIPKFPPPLRGEGERQHLGDEEMGDLLVEAAKWLPAAQAGSREALGQVLE